MTPPAGTLAWLQRFTTLGLLALALGWAVAFAVQGRWAWAAGGALLILFAYALVLGLEFVFVALQHRDDPVPRASAGQLLRAWWGEALTAPTVFCWRQPFRSTQVPDRLGAGSAGRQGIVFVHGFVCNRGIWNPLLHRLDAAGVPVVAVNLEPVFGAIDDYPPIIESAVAAVERATGLPPLIVAHSMGGLAARAWFAAQPDPQRVRRIVTIGTPHRGTWLARFASTENGRQMQPGSAWLRALEQGESPAARAFFTCFYSHCDNIVFPASNATLPEADNRHLPGVAHVHMAFHDAVFAEVSHWLASPQREP